MASGGDTGKALNLFFKTADEGGNTLPSMILQRNAMNLFQ